MSSPASVPALGTNLLTTGLILRSLGIICTYYIVRFFYKLYVVRMRYRSLTKDHGIQILPHSFLFGHLIEVGKLLESLPPDASGQCFPLLFARKHPELFKDGVVYVDTWPFGPLMMAVLHPDMMAQFTQDNSRPKHELMSYEFEPFTGNNDLVNQEGQVWKMWRSIFNPGFSSRNLLSFVPEIIEEVMVFKDFLKKQAESRTVTEFELTAMKLTMDVIGRVTLNTRMHIQTTDSDLFNAFRLVLSWLIIDNSPRSLVKWMNPARLAIIWYNNRIMRNYLVPHIKQAMSGSGSNDSRKTVINLAANAFKSEAKTTSSSNAAFIDMAVSQLKMFIFAGHDTTATALNYMYHLLSSNPETLRKIRAEHDEVFGSDPALAADTIIEKPHLLNSLPYTSAVIKETLRLYAPVGSIRRGEKGFFLTNPESGHKYPTEGFLLFSNSMGSHRWGPNVTDEPDTFKPERWLSDVSPMRKNAYRPFELGPRGCIGQELAQIELKIILALTLREFDIETALDPNGPKMFGDIAYQIMRPGDLTGKPVGGSPMHIRFRKGNSSSNYQME